MRRQPRRLAGNDRPEWVNLALFALAVLIGAGLSVQVGLNAQVDSLFGRELTPETGSPLTPSTATFPGPSIPPTMVNFPK